MGVVDIASHGGTGAAREPTRSVTRLNKLTQRTWRPVSRTAVIKQVAGHGIGHQPPPRCVAREVARDGARDRAVTDELRRVVTQPEQRRQVDHDLELDALLAAGACLCSVLARSAATGDQRDERICAPGIDAELAAVLVSGAGARSGCRVERLEDRASVKRWERRDQRHHSAPY
jgi:hypothetical protein